MWKRGFVIAKCTICESLKDLISKARKKNPSVKEHEIKLKKHNIHQEFCWHSYHTWKVEFVQCKEDFLFVIHDKMDHSKTGLPQLQVKNKMVFELGQLPMTLIKMIVHVHGDKAFVQYFNEFWPNNPNFIIGSLLHLLRSLEKELVRES